MLVVGITGSIGSGKTALAAALKEKGAEVLDADQITHEVLRCQPQAQQVIEEFGKSVIDKDGKIDRKQLAEIVFSNPEKLKVLNRILHPKIIAEIGKRLEQIRKEGCKAVTVIDAPLIIEAGMRGMLDLLVVVVAKDELRLARATKLGLSEEEIRVRNKYQMPQEAKIQFADYIIKNEGSLDELWRKADDLWEFLQKKLGEKRV